ncbi:hypothetical protein JXO59_12060 [candidate division KSB1 bacterium]|nr:hypothetical protein [candidate division KSB1 bacterium]
MTNRFSKIWWVAVVLVASMYLKGTSAMDVQEFSKDLRKCLTPANHLWVMSGWSTVHPLDKTVMGVGECFSPPLAARGFSMHVHFRADGHFIPDVGSIGKNDVGLLYSGGCWYPDRVERHGTYHFNVNGNVLSLQCSSALYPLTNRGGFLLEVTVLNRGKQSILLEILPQINPGFPNLRPLNNWTYDVPAKGAPAESTTVNRWENDLVAVSLLHDVTSFRLSPGESRKLFLALVLSRKDETISQPPHFNDWKIETKRVWQERLDAVEKTMPRLRSDIPGFEAYYKSSLMSGLVCMWENPDFVVRPFLSSLGMDGGGMCTYLWDIGGYIDQAATLLLNKHIIKLADAFKKFDLNEHYAFTLDGTGIGPWYSYNTFSFVNLAWTISNQLGVQPHLFQEARKLVEHDEKYLPQADDLTNYGVQLNLLEMRGMGWEHFVVSPNAERAWCLERLADMGDQLGYPGTSEWRRKAQLIREAIRAQLWDAESKWFRSRYPDGHHEMVYSIQVYDALRAGVCTPEMVEDVVSHLHDGAFLGTFGVSSISAEDTIHYELNDPDWSGGGAYIGEGPILAQTLYEIGKPELAWDVLQHLFWMGQYLPYFPQECYCDKAAVVAHKRANEVSGLAGLQAIVFGMAGFEPKMDGSLWLNPHPPKTGKVTLSGYPFQGRRIDLDMAPDYCRISVDEVIVHQGRPRRLKVFPK